jgi:YVTN family beta-propeller protein
MDFRILGTLEVRDGSRPLMLGGEKQRALLAILLLHRNEVVSADRLIDELWGESPPAGARQTLRAYVSKLRRAMGPNGASHAVPGASNGTPGEGVLLTKARGYLLQVASGELDLERFAEGTERGRDALVGGKPDEAARLLREALSLWRGAPLAEFTYAPFAQPAIAQLNELHLAAVEERIDADLALGHARELVGELRDLVGHHPLRDRLRVQLMLALYRAGRQAEALEVYQNFRRALSEELGLEPGPGLQQLELAILNRDPGLDLPAGAKAPRAIKPPSVPSGTPARRRRRRRPVALAVGVLLLAFALVVVVAMASRGHARAVVIPGDAVGAISPSSGAIRTVVPLGSSPSGVASGAGAIWIASPNQDTVSRISPAARAVVQTIQVGSSPAAVAVGSGAVWVTNYYGQTVSRIDPSVDRVVQTIPVGNGPTGLAVGDGSVWVANAGDGTVSRINAVSGVVSDTISLGGAGATDVAIGAGDVWVSDEAGDRVVQIDPKADQVIATINVGSGPTAIAVGIGSVWVTNSLDGTVSRIDPATGTVQATIEVGNGADAIAIGAGAVWVSDQYAGTVARIDPATDSVTRTISVGNPQGVAVADGLVWVGARPAAASHRGGTLIALGSGVLDTLDPVFTADLGGLLALTNDGLTAYQQVGGSGSVQLVPDLAVSLPSPTDGGTTYTFQLRRGIRYSDGELVRPEDFRRALERDLILGPSSNYGDVFADVVGGAACAAHPSGCDLSRGVVTDDAANTVTFHLVAPDPDFLARLTLPDAFAVPAGTPMHNIGYHPLPATGPYKWGFISYDKAILERNPYFHEWSHAAQPDGYPDQIVARHSASQADELTAIEQGRADVDVDGVPTVSVNQLELRFANRLYTEPNYTVNWLILNTRVAPFNDLRVRQALSYAIDRGKITRLAQTGGRPTCQMLTPFILGYRPYCPYTLDPNPSGSWTAPNVAEARRLIAATHTRGTPITIWNLGGTDTDYTSIEPYLTSLLDELGYPTKIKDLQNDFPQAPARFADSRTQAQAALGASYLTYPSPAVIQASFACQSFRPDSPENANASEFCDPQLDAQINNALAAESNNSPDAASRWAQADQTATDQAPAIPLNIPSTTYLVSARVGNYQYSLTAGYGVLLDQLWVR